MAASTWVQHGITETMNRFNRRNSPVIADNDD
jgi:hypothetical protein